MARKAVTKLSFIGGSLQPKGAIVDFPDEKLRPREERDGDTSKGSVPTPNLVDVGKSARMAVVEVAAIAPTGPNPTDPQVLPPGSIQTAQGYSNDDGAKLVGQGSELAAQAGDGPTTQDVIEEEGTKRAFDHDGDGEDGGSKPADPPSLSGKNKAELQAIATDEGVEWNEGMTNAELTDAITAKRG